VDEWRRKGMEREKEKRMIGRVVQLLDALLLCPGWPRIELTNQGILSLLGSDQASNDISLQSALYI
jgi:hypothetical protein